MNVHTRSQKIAQAAYSQIAVHTGDGARKPNKEFVSTVKKFPALIHTCGLAQAVAFALAKKEDEFIDYLAVVLRAAGHDYITDAQSLDQAARTQPLSTYLRLSRDALNAASWLKRYVEAAVGEEE
ncbi:MAG: type III-B CRISPR module-associated protein Cmr5 [Chloracidobacterium sp.]|uniref:CRISPR type III-B/RAMP module-associated protein Cmr5 n=1 Tax=Chloracidobacterium validum TaxID=2821543 RepID=A0ABX8B6A5_9BACT|nr:type III-B CRISPR module-associated protein Cmr5 [Chloracidobacterium validum]QUW02498.1 type III-B CRISPR module-associated protein Cmr5 [Chloracidobacterium validum]